MFKWQVAKQWLDHKPVFTNNDNSVFVYAYLQKLEKLHENKNVVFLGATGLQWVSLCTLCIFEYLNLYYFYTGKKI